LRIETCFSTFAPVALAGIGALPGTVGDRSVPIVLKRKTAAETAIKLRKNGARKHLGDLASKLARWSADRRAHLGLDPVIPDAMGDREGDIAVPLLSIADDAGGPWPERARSALLALFGLRQDDDEGELGVVLLHDIRALFSALSATRLSSERIVQDLVEKEDRPWAEMRPADKPITKNRVARLLKPYGIAPKVTRDGAGAQFRGYDVKDFKEPWARYLRD